MADIFGAVTGIKAAYDIARAAIDVNDQARLNTAISDIIDQLTSAQSGLLELQQQHHQLIEENRQLRRKIDKEARFEQYRLERTPDGDYVYFLKIEFESPEHPLHAICPKCKEDGRLSPLGEEQYFYHCKTCKTSYSRHPLPPLRR
ncbi:DUF2716 domain-containing protein [Billgrantia kenyensis]|uniref:DUF2716 domain-containing protein n=1 Tax=Billgrantia kenyensis TaxID=321266 RepID=A0A7V9W353_9GAMM|nr:DUF2716 domain-containing protein [Halomonas kenyensis]MBA2780181.1 DUF2716 domain-containing protein [Halomonas kenyensis]MCG6663163.1 DUF2716 domain-containing protein [Halomonas kenyensis]